MSTPSAQERFAELAARVDALFDRAAARYPEAIACSEGCADCCAAGLTVTVVEASLIAEILARMPAVERRAIAVDARAADSSRCVALDREGRCRVYAGRPLVCRSHGLPIRAAADSTDESPTGALAVCPRNFAGASQLAAVDADCILDQRTLSTVLGAIDMAFADEQACPRGERIAIADLLAEPERYFEIESDSDSEV